MKLCLFLPSKSSPKKDIFWLVFLVLISFIFHGTKINAQTQNTQLPVALTVPIGGANLEGGEVVVFNDVLKSYTLARAADEVGVFGVTVQTPPLVFLTASNTVPVLTGGTLYLNVISTNEPIRRGDLLVTAGQPQGVAAKVGEDDENAFAIALEDAPQGRSVSKIMVHFNPSEAKELLILQRERETEATATSSLGFGDGDGLAGNNEETVETNLIPEWLEKYSRGTIAAIIAVGSIFFIMYTFRSTITNATLSVGRNPRARNAILVVSIGNILFALVIGAVAIFVAIAVLVLPVQ